MAIKTKRKKNSSANAQSEPTPEGTGVANTPVSRRTLLKGTASAAAVVGASFAMRGMKFNRFEASSSSSTTTTTIQTNTATLPAPPPIVTTDPAGQRTVTLNVNGKN